MGRLPVIAIFDVGKTNKKVFLFDEGYHIVFEESVQLPETVDEDGFPCENVQLLTEWIETTFDRLDHSKDFFIKAINFSAYGASFVHLDEQHKPITPLYNYLKPYPRKLQNHFYQNYGGESAFALQTASPVLGNLNSGMQLYRLKYEQPSVFDRIQYSLHLPQYVSFVITEKTVSDITSIGCHTNFWHFEKNNYHDWVHVENIFPKLAPVHSSDQIIDTGKKLLSGIGLHDSSAALIPYHVCFNEPFALISTGTWCISLNPFNHTTLTAEELLKDCLCYMSHQGKPIKASRLFAGHEHEQQVKRLGQHFNKATDYYKTVQFNPAVISLPAATLGNQYVSFTEKELSQFDNYEVAYHEFMLDITMQQFTSTQLVLKGAPVNKLYVDGGFSTNPVYMNLLAIHFPDIEIYAGSIAQASALGAAIVLHEKWNNEVLPNNIIDLTLYKSSAPLYHI